jgi:hypothetical protein
VGCIAKEHLLNVKILSTMTFRKTSAQKNENENTAQLETQRQKKRRHSCSRKPHGACDVGASVVSASSHAQNVEGARASWPKSSTPAWWHVRARPSGPTSRALDHWSNKLDCMRSLYFCNPTHSPSHGKRQHIESNAKLLLFLLFLLEDLRFAL